MRLLKRLKDNVSNLKTKTMYEFIKLLYQKSGNFRLFVCLYMKYVYGNIEARYEDAKYRHFFIYLYNHYMGFKEKCEFPLSILPMACNEWTYKGCSILVTWEGMFKIQTSHLFKKPKREFTSLKSCKTYIDKHIVFKKVKKDNKEKEAREIVECYICWWMGNICFKSPKSPLIDYKNLSDEEIIAYMTKESEDWLHCTL